MIAIQKIGRSFSGALKYNLKKLNHVDLSKRAELLGTNFAALNFALINKEVDLVRSLRPNLNRYVYHTSLNFPKEEQSQLLNNKLLAIALDYLEASGFSNNQYIIFRHHDTDHPHIHLLANRIGFDGSVVSDSNNYKKSEAILRELEYRYNLIAVAQSNFRATERHNNITIEPNNKLSAGLGERQAGKKEKEIASDLYSNVTVEQTSVVTTEPYNDLSSRQRNLVTKQRTTGVTKQQNNYVFRKPPTRDEVGMMIRTGKASDKLLLQELLNRLITEKPASMAEFIQQAERFGICLLYNQASTGRVSGITYFFKDFKAKGQALGSKYKWAELTKQISYDQIRDAKAIAEANIRTKEKYGDFGSEAIQPNTNPVEGYAGKNEMDEATLIEGSRDLNTLHLDNLYLNIEITDDVDDERMFRKSRPKR